ncbi:hypothetical protein EKK58_02540 [Candidatus Dependentiae bacterium]|nr:MAG: hypothetical protein EKK58_02540 [Candidatus Dependentiae bacterium]
MNIKKLYISVTCFCFWPIIKAEPIIQLNIVEDSAEKAIRIKKKIEQKGSVGKVGFNHFVDASPVAGFFGMYAGMLAMSDNAGSIRFQRKHTEPVMYIAITQDIVPIMRIENTVHHWQFVPNAAVLFYKLEPKIDKEKNKLFWHIQEMEVPHNLIIPAEAIVVFANPTYCYFDITAAYVAYINPNIFLPPLISKKGINAIKSSLHLLSIRHFFAPLQPVIRTGQKAYRLIVQP